MEFRAEIRNGLATIKFPVYESNKLIEKLNSAVRNNTRTYEWENTHKVSITQTLNDMARASRMCYELWTTNTLTDLSQEDMDVLRKLPTDSGTLSIQGEFQRIRDLVRESGVDDVECGHRLAKSLMTIQTG
jgi:hypothetical protein